MDKSLSDQAELLRAAQSTSGQQRAEMEDMKSLLAAREADHRREMEHRYTIDSPKLEELFQSKITSLVRENAAERNEYEHRYAGSVQRGLFVNFVSISSQVGASCLWKLKH